MFSEKRKKILEKKMFKNILFFILLIKINQQTIIYNQLDKILNFNRNT